MSASSTRGDAVEELLERYPRLMPCAPSIRAALDVLLACFRAGGSLYVCGNGGSAADTEHVVGELVKSFKFKRPVSRAFRDAYRRANGCDAPAWLEGALPAFSLVSQTALMTAFTNDEAAEGAMAQQVYAYAGMGDALLCISTSGNSANVVHAAKVARAKGCAVVALTGARESKLSRLADVCVRAPESETFKIQELHLPIYHALCATLEAELFAERAEEDAGC